MKKIILLILICTLINGCGIFKKTSKDVKKVEQFGKTEQLREAKNQENEQSKEQSSTTTNEQVQEREKNDIDNETTLEADEIDIDDKGNIKARGGAKVTKKQKEKSEKETNANKATQEDIFKEITKDSQEQKKEQAKQETKAVDYSKETISETDFWGVIAGAIGVLIVVFGICWYFGVKKK